MKTEAVVYALTQNAAETFVSFHNQNICNTAVMRCNCSSHSRRSAAYNNKIKFFQNFFNFVASKMYPIIAAIFTFFTLAKQNPLFLSTKSIKMCKQDVSFQIKNHITLYFVDIFWAKFYIFF